MELPKPSRETKFLGANGDREKVIFPVQLTTSRIGNLTRLILTCYMCDHTYSTVHEIVQRTVSSPFFSIADLLDANYSCNLKSENSSSPVVVVGECNNAAPLLQSTCGRISGRYATPGIGNGCVRINNTSSGLFLLPFELPVAAYYPLLLLKILSTESRSRPSHSSAVYILIIEIEERMTVFGVTYRHHRDQDPCPIRVEPYYTKKAVGVAPSQRVRYGALDRDATCPVSP